MEVRRPVSRRAWLRVSNFECGISYHYPIQERTSKFLSFHNSLVGVVILARRVGRYLRYLVLGEKQSKDVRKASEYLNLAKSTR
jgi:hypothetical protein